MFALHYIPRDDPVIITNVLVVVISEHNSNPSGKSRAFPLPEIPLYKFFPKIKQGLHDLRTLGKRELGSTSCSVGGTPNFSHVGFAQQKITNSFTQTL